MEYQEHLERVELPSARVKMGNVYYLQLLVYSMSSRRETVRQKSYTIISKRKANQLLYIVL